MTKRERIAAAWDEYAKIHRAASPTSLGRRDRDRAWGEFVRVRAEIEAAS